jgi:hypothetical protein
MLVSDELVVPMREATVHIRDVELETIGLGEFISLCRDAGLRDITELTCHGPGGIIVVQVETPLAEQNLSRLDCLEWWERLERAGAGAVYLCKVEAPGLHDTPTDQFVRELSHDGINVRDRGIDLSLVGTQAAISQSVTEYSNTGMRLLLHKLIDYRGPNHALDILTDRQREVIHAAYARGYFEVPRRVSLTDLAAELGLDPSTVSEHLHRAEHNLLTQLLGAD